MKTKLLTMAAALTALAFTSCKNDQPTPTLYHSKATVHKTDSVNNYTLITDEDEVLKPVNARRILKDRQRIIAYFNVVSEQPEGSAYDYEIEYVDLYEILTKGLFDMGANPTKEVEDSIGHAPYVDVEEPWIAADYLNVQFFLRTAEYSNAKHLINLVAYPDSMPAADGRIHLMMRHNDHQVSPEINSWGIAAFDLLPLKKQFAGQDSLNIMLHAPLYNNKEKIYKITYHLKDGEADAPAPASIPAGQVFRALCE